jgi:hypothetical protein
VHALFGFAAILLTSKGMSLKLQLRPSRDTYSTQVQYRTSSTSTVQFTRHGVLSTAGRERLKGSRAQLEGLREFTEAGRELLRQRDSGATAMESPRDMQLDDPDAYSQAEYQSPEQADVSASLCAQSSEAVPCSESTERTPEVPKLFDLQERSWLVSQVAIAIEGVDINARKRLQQDKTQLRAFLRVAVQNGARLTWDLFVPHKEVWQAFANDCASGCKIVSLKTYQTLLNGFAIQLSEQLGTSHALYSELRTGNLHPWNTGEFAPTHPKTAD